MFFKFWWPSPNIWVLWTKMQRICLSQRSDLETPKGHFEMSFCCLQISLKTNKIFVRISTLDLKRGQTRIVRKRVKIKPSYQWCPYFFDSVQSLIHFLFSLSLHVKFIYSEKTLHFRFECTVKLRWRFRKILCPSQNI